MDRPRQAWGADDAPLSSGRVEIDHLSFAYRGDRIIAHHQTGEGTLPAAGMPDQGHKAAGRDIQRDIDGRPLASLSHSALRRGIAMVQQDPVVLADTFYANSPSSDWRGYSSRCRYARPGPQSCGKGYPA
jgi:ATP-binding cassette subfamily B multidrug efflux pump